MSRKQFRQFINVFDNCIFLKCLDNTGNTFVIDGKAETVFVEELPAFQSVTCQVVFQRVSKECFCLLC